MWYMFLMQCSRLKLSYEGVTTLGGSDSHLCVVIGLGQLTHQSWHKSVSHCRPCGYALSVSFWRALEVQPFSWRASSKPRRQSKNIEMKCKTHIKLVHELYATCFPTQCEKLRINHLTPFVVVTLTLRLSVLVADELYWGLQVTSSFSPIWGCVLKG